MPPNSEIEKLERRWKENPKGTVFAPYAEVLRKNGDHLEARDVLRQGLELHPDHIPGNIVLGRCCLDLREDGPAEAAFTHVLDLDPENVIALKALADITERQGRLMEARTWLARLMSVDPSNDEARDQLDRVDAAREAAAAAITAPLTVEVPAAESAGASSSETTATVEVVARTFAPQPSTMAEVSAGEVSEAPLDVDDAVDAALGAYDPPARTREIIAPEVPDALAGLDDADTVPILPVVPRDAPAVMDLEPVELDMVEAARELTPEPLAGIESDEPFAPPPATGEPAVYAIGGEEVAPLELRPSGTGEFQSPDDSAELLELASSASEFQVPDASSELKFAGSAGSEYQTPSGAEELLSRIEQTPEPEALSLPEPELEPEPVASTGPTFVPSGPVTTGFAAITLMPTEELSTSAPAEPEPEPEPVAPVAPAAEITLEVPAYTAPTSYEIPSEAPPPAPEPVAISAEPEPEPVSIVDELTGAGGPVAMQAEEEAGPPWEAPLPDAEPEPAPPARPSDLKLIFPEDADEPEPPRVRRISQEVSAPEPAIEPEPAPVAEAVPAEPAPVLTESMAELYARQGHLAEALNVYRTLLARQPNDARLADRVRQLEQQRAAGSRRLSYVAVDTGGESVESFFRGLAGARPAGVEGPVDDDGEGAPTRPARDPLSLSAIFGEEPAAAPAPKATEPVQRSGAPDAFSFDQFFGGSAPGTPTTGPRQAMPSDEDLDQFQHWLKSLKR